MAPTVSAGQVLRLWRVGLPNAFVQISWGNAAQLYRVATRTGNYGQCRRYHVRGLGV